MKHKVISLIVATVLLSGCVSKTITRAVGVTKQDEICIIHNPAVKHEFEQVYRESIEKRGFKTSIIGEDDGKCLITSTYTATYGFHWGMYLATADLKVFKNKVEIGRAQYKAPMADPTKHGRVAGKVDDLVTVLLP